MLVEISLERKSHEYIKKMVNGKLCLTRASVSMLVASNHFKFSSLTLSGYLIFYFSVFHTSFHFLTGPFVWSFKTVSSRSSTWIHFCDIHFHCYHPHNVTT